MTKKKTSPKPLLQQSVMTRPTFDKKVTKIIKSTKEISKILSSLQIR